MTRKSLPKTALPRIYRIDEMIAAGGYPNTGEIARAYETSVSSVSRDIEFMRDFFDAPIAYCARRRGYYYREKTFRLPGSFTTAENIQALGMIKTLLNLYRETPLYGAAKALLDGITAPLREEQNPGLYENRIVAPPVAAAPVDPGLWDIITGGLRENRVITFAYRGLVDGDYLPRRVRPYQLLFDNGVWSLYSFDEDRGAIRIFSLSRMRDAALTGKTFTLPRDYDYLAQNAGGVAGSYFGVFAGPRYCFRIAFYGWAAVAVTERIWAADQSFEEIPGGVIIRFTSSQYNRVLEWVLSHGAFAAPLEPAALADQWKWHVKEMGKRRTPPPIARVSPGGPGPGGVPSDRSP